VAQQEDREHGDDDGGPCGAVKPSHRGMSTDKE